MISFEVVISGESFFISLNGINPMKLDSFSVENGNMVLFDNSMEVEITHQVPAECLDLISRSSSAVFMRFGENGEIGEVKELVQLKGG